MNTPINTLDPDESQDLLGHFVGRVEQAFFSTPKEESKGEATYAGADQPKEYWHVRVLDVLQSGYDGVVPATLTINWGLGKGWYIAENGLYVHHKDDAPFEQIQAGRATPRVFKSSSGLGMFLYICKGSIKSYENDFGSATALDGDGELEYDLYPNVREYLTENGLTDSRDATIWFSTVWEFRGIGLRFDADRKPRMQVRPVKFMGVDDGEGVGVTSSNKPAEASNPNPATDPQTWAAHGAGSDLAGTLSKLATSSSSHIAFSKNALLLPDVKGNEELSKAVLDEANWE